MIDICGTTYVHGRQTYIPYGYDDIAHLRHSAVIGYQKEKISIYLGCI